MKKHNTGKNTKHSQQQAVAYARVSSKEQEKEGFSIPAQLKLLRDYASMHGIAIVEEYTDVETAKQTGRTNFTKMVSFLKDEIKHHGEGCPCPIILVEKTDRLYRNIKDWVTLDDVPLEVHFVKENVIMSPSSKSSEKFMHGIKVLMAKNYIDNLSEETKKGMMEKASQGIWPSCAPIGYLNVECSGKRLIQPDPEQSTMIAKLFEWYSTGNYSLLEVTKKARAEGLAYRKSGDTVQKSLVYKILVNPIYYGDFDWAGKLYHGSHEPIVSRELWDQVQSTLAKKGLRNTRQQKHAWPFQGLVSCGHCGCALVAERKKGKYVYYHCTGYRGKCPEKYVRQETLASQYMTALEAMIFGEEVMEWVTTALKASHKDEKQYHDGVITTLQQQYSRTQSRLDAMYVDKLDATISQDMYDRKSDEWRREQHDILQQIQMHENANSAYFEEGVRILELSQKAASLFEQREMDEKRQLLNLVFSNSVWKDGMLWPTYRRPFDLIVNAEKTAVDNSTRPGQKFDKEAKNEEWLPGVDSNHEPPG
jgi:site-specific DNA recombinase